MSNTLGAPFGGTTRGGHHVFESLTSSLITPPNFAGGAGSCLPLTVVVALGAPGVPVICWAKDGAPANVKSAAASSAALQRRSFNIVILIFFSRLFWITA